jgi:hypothetical protein
VPSTKLTVPQIMSQKCPNIPHIGKTPNDRAQWIKDMIDQYAQCSSKENALRNILNGK